MAVQSTIEEVNNFLVTVKSLVAAGSYDFIPRPKNNLTNLGINLKIALDIILGLTYKNYFSGPEEDNNPKYVGLIWEFGKD